MSARGAQASSTGATAGIMDHTPTATGDAANTFPTRDDKDENVLFRDVPKMAKMIIPEWFQEQTNASEVRWDKGEVKYPLHLVNGTYQGLHQEEKATNDLIRSFETRDSDVFVCTFVKSGTTWVQQIINLLLNQGETRDKHLSEVVPWLEALTFAGVGTRPQEENIGSAYFLTLDELKSTPNRRFMKTHANLHDLPAGTAKGLKVIYVARNPKDVCVSLLHHARNSPYNAFEGEFADMFNCFVRGRCTNGSWFKHVLEWWKAAKADPEHVMFLHYEDMLAYPEEHIRKIADFTGIDCTSDIISKTVKESAFSAMKASSKVNIYPSYNHYRKGRKGGWRDVFTVRQSEAFDKIYRQQMKGSDLTMDFGEGLVM